MFQIAAGSEEVVVVGGGGKVSISTVKFTRQITDLWSSVAPISPSLFCAANKTLPAGYINLIIRQII